MPVKITEIAAKMNALGRKKEPFFFAINFNCTEAIITPCRQAASSGIWYEAGQFTNAPPSHPLSVAFDFQAFPIPVEQYRSAFETVMHHLEYGNTYLLNLTFPTRIETSLSLAAIFRRAEARHRLLVEDCFVVFSPETFVRIRDGKISSNPMKGTIDARLEHAGEMILADEKEKAEHYTIVDLIRNDLSMVATNVRVERFRYVERIETSRGALLQVSSEISGDLEAGYAARIGDIVTALLPAGSVSGAPKRKTVEIIREAEMDERGFYTGVFGVFDGRCMESAVMIRFIEKTENGLFYRSGGGITAMSRMQEEYEELIAKVYVPFV